ncbi:AraC family transcriptional regulator [Streptomyces sp. NPDC092369]|uniref:AraC family transcriptional regulator n=1 Tax=Streptomyces sp. NPDC092369 TaxID=3366015 RepID=UPI003810EE45
MTETAHRAAEFSRYETRSVEETHDSIATHYYDARLVVMGERADFSNRFEVADLGALTVGRITFGTEMRFGFGEPGCYHVIVPLEGVCSVRQGSEDFGYATSRRALFFDPEHHIRMDTWSNDCDALTVKVDKLALHSTLETLLGTSLRRPPKFAPALDVTRGPARSWAALARWTLLEADVAQGLLSNPLIRGRFEQTLLEGLLLAADHDHRDHLAYPPPMRPASVRRVMDVVQELPAEPYDAAGLAAIAQVGLRTLQDAFRKHVGMSPMAYVTEVRLQRVHDQLRVSAPGTATVAEVAYRWGFTHLGRFAQRYRRRFGEPPSQTLRTM